MMDVVNGFDEPAEQAYALICAIYRASDSFVATIEEAFPTRFSCWLSRERRWVLICSWNPGPWPDSPIPPI